MTSTPAFVRPSRAVTIWRLLLAAVAVAVPAWVGLTRFEVLRAGHPAYPMVLGGLALVGLVLLVLTVVRPPRPAQRRLLVGVGRVLLTTLVVLLAAASAWLRPFPSTEAGARVAAGDGAGVVVQDDTTRTTLRPGGASPTVGLIFQPGARVDHRAYLPLLTRIAAAGTLVVVIKQPLDVGLLAINEPESVIAAHPEISRWVVGGHSLGGVAASQYAAAHADKVVGLLLWASYPLDSLAGRTDLQVTSISGTRDAFTTPADVAKSRGLLPAQTTFVAVEGGIHSYFGDYGRQPGDGDPAIDREVAQDQIVEASVALLDKVGQE